MKKNTKKKAAAKASASNSSLQLDPTLTRGLEETRSQLVPQILKCLESSTLSQQQQGLKTLSLIARDLDDDELENEPIPIVVKLLLSILFHPDATHPSKRQIMRILSSFPSRFHGETVSLLAETFVNADNCFRVETANAVSLCLQNDFDLGTEAALSRADFVCSILTARLGDLLSNLGEGSGEDQLATKKMLSILKTLSVIAMRDRRSVTTDSKMRIEDNISKIMAMENLPLDCHTSAAICLLQLKRHGEDDPYFDADFVENQMLTFSNRITDKICIYYALLSSWPIGSEKIRVEKEFENLNRVFGGLGAILRREEQINAGHLLLLSRCFLQWIKKVGSLVDISVEDFKNFCASSHQINELLQFIWSHWEHPMDCLRHHLEEIFINVLSLDKKCGSERFRSRLLDTLVYGNYLLLLSAYVKIHGVAEVLRTNPTFPRCVLKMMIDSSYACQVTKLYANCLLTVPERDRTIWTEAISELLIESDPSSSWILSTTIPKISRNFPEILATLLDNLMEVDDLNSNVHVLGALMKCLRLANRENKSIGVTANMMKVLKLSLTCADEQISLEAFAFLTEIRKPSLPIPSGDLALIINFLRENAFSQSPSFRQSLFSLLSNLLISLCISASHLRKEHNEQNGHHLSEYNNFLESILQVFIDGLSTSANYPRRTTALNSLKHLFEYVWEDEVGKQIFPLSHFIEKNSHIFPIIRCLSDTYEDNMELSLIILEKYTLLCKQVNPQFVLLSSEFANELWNDSFEKLKSTKPQDSLSASYIIRFLVMIGERNLLSTLDILTESLISQVDIAAKSLIEAAESAPMYGTFLCLRHILWNLDIESSLDSKMAHIINKLVVVAFRASNLVGPIVSTSSPEGFMPDSENEECKATSTVTAQMLLLSCWRTMKEVSLHLGIACEKLSNLKHENEYVLPPKTIEKIGNDFLEQMMMSKHRGAFEVGYEGFMKVAKVLMASHLPELYNLPEVWMTSLLESSGNCEIVTNTRRSAGLPFCIVAIMSAAQPRYSKKGAEIFASTMKTLIETAGRMEEISVHSLNILRMIVKDTRFGDGVLAYVGDCFVISIRGFSNVNWMVKNSSTLLFSALMQRTFGVYSRGHAEDHDEKRPPLANCLTSLEFFTRFNSMWQFIFDILEDAKLRGNATSLNPSSFPVLLILSRLLPSPQEEKNGKESLKDLIHLIVPCLSSPIMKTRSLAAKALIPLLDKKFFTSLVKEINEGRDNNEMHGKMLVLKYFLRLERRTLTFDHLAALEPLFSFHESPTFDNNLLVQSAFWDLQRSMIDVDSPSHSESLRNARGTLYDLVILRLNTYVECSSSFQHVPGFSFAVRSASALFVRLFDDRRDRVGLKLVKKVLESNTNREILAACTEHLCEISFENDHVATDIVASIFEAVTKNLRDRDCLSNLLKLAAYVLNAKSSLSDELPDRALDDVLLICESTKSEIVSEMAVNVGGVLFSKMGAVPNGNDSLERFLSILEKSSDPEESGAVRLASAKVLPECSELFLEESTPIDVRLRFWLLCYELCSAEERNVRTVVLNGFRKKSSKDILHTMVERLGKNHPWECFDALAHLLLDPLSYSDDVPSCDYDAQLVGAEQLFEKGERNTFAEEKWEILEVGESLKTLWQAMSDIPGTVSYGESVKKNLKPYFDNRQLSFPLKLGVKVSCRSLEDLTQLTRWLAESPAISDSKESSQNLLEFFKNPTKNSKLELDYLRVREYVNALC